MQIFCVLTHGEFRANVQLSEEELFARGFYTTRWVLAGDERTATEKAFRSARLELNKWSNVRAGLISVEMQVEEIGPGSFWRWLRGGGRGFAFYVDEKDLTRQRAAHDYTHRWPHPLFSSFPRKRESTLAALKGSGTPAFAGVT